RRIDFLLARKGKTGTDYVGEPLVEPKEDKSVPARCEEAYDEAIQLLREWDKNGITSVQNRTNTEAFLSKPNPFKEAEIVPDDVDVFMDLLEDEKQKWPEPNLPSDVEQFKKRLRDIMYFKETDSDYTHTGK